jgi:HK97 family phage major capsid protein
MEDDAIINVSDWVTNEVARAFLEKEDDCLFNGDGTSTYGGMIGVLKAIIDGTHTAGAKDAASGHDTFAEYDAADMATIMAALPPEHLGTAAWYCSQPAFALTFQRLVVAGGGNTIDTLAGPARYQFLGYRVVISQKMPVLATDLSDTAVILFGDLRKAALMGTRREIRILRSEHFAANLDQIAIFATERFDINVHGLGDNTRGGAVVALIAE